MNEISTIEKIASLYQIALSKITEHIHSVLVAAISDFLIPVLTLYFIVMGYKTVMGDFDTEKKNMLRIFIILPFLIVTLFNYGFYLEVVSTPLLSLKDWLVTAISNIGSFSDVETGTSFKALDNMFMNLYNFIDHELMDGSFITNVMDHLVGILLLIIYGGLYIWISYFMIKSLVAVGFFLLIGIVPLFLFAFDGTKHITFAWFRTLITYWLYAPISAFFMIFVYWVTNAGSSNLSTSFSSLFLLVVSGGVLGMLIKDIPEYANSLTNSMSGSGSPIESAINSFRWGGFAANKGGKAASNLYSAGKAMKNNFKG